MSASALITDGDPLLTLAEVSAALRIPESTLRYLRGVGRGPESFKVAGRIVYRTSAVTEYLDTQMAETSSSARSA